MIQTREGRNIKSQLPEQNFLPMPFENTDRSLPHWREDKGEARYADFSSNEEANSPETVDGFLQGGREPNI